MSVIVIGPSGAIFVYARFVWARGHERINFTRSFKGSSKSSQNLKNFESTNEINP